MTSKPSPHRKAPAVRAIPILSESANNDEGDSEVDSSLADSELLQEAEREIGINEWIDAETGEPAEGQSPPHLEQD